MHRMGIVRRDHEGLGQHLSQLQTQCSADTLQSALQQHRCRALHRIGTNLFTVEDTQYRNRRIFTAVQEALRTAPCAL